jgi:ElaB/YqjD/DUF883 family membrane-anchored ribosome-binding protein
MTSSFTSGHALIIGTGTYQHTPEKNVPITVADAQEVAAVLRNPQYCGYPDAQVKLLTDEQATREYILAALDALAQQTRTEDTVLLFYSGHGEYDQQHNFYLTTHDTRLDGKHIVPDTAISQAELLEKLRAIKAGRVLLLFNACHAGEVSPVLGDSEPSLSGQPLPQQATDALLSTGSGRIIITACREHQVSFVGAGAQTIFAQALVAGLRGQGLSSKAGYISAFDLYTHMYFAIEDAVDTQVIPALKQRHGAAQEPELTILKGVGPFAVALYRGMGTLGAFPEDHAPAEGTAVRRVNPQRSQWAMQSIISTATVQGDNHGQNVGINYGTMTQNQQNIHNNAPNQGAQGEFHGPVTFNQQRSTLNQQGQKVQGNQYNANRDLIQSGGDVNQVSGDYVGGDKVGGDKINAQESQGFINRPTGPVSQNFGRQRNINTGGGSYIERQQDQFTLSGNFQGALLNIKSNLSHVNQSIGALPNVDDATRAELQRLVSELEQLLQQVPPEQAKEAETLAKRLETLLEESGKPEPDREMVAFSAQSLQKAASNIAAVLPAVLPIATRITEHIVRLAG